MRRLALALPIALGFGCAPADAHIAHRSAFVGHLDGEAPGLFSVCAAAKVISTYAGPLYNTVRESDGANEDVYPGPDGWPDKTALAAWSQGTLLVAPICYDQLGHGINRALANANTAGTTIVVGTGPVLNLAGAHPTFVGDGATMTWAGGSDFTALGNGSAALSALIVRKWGVVNNTLQTLVFVTSGTSVATGRLQLYMQNGKTASSGIRADADTSKNTAGQTQDSAWHVEYAANVAGTLKHAIDGIFDTLGTISTQVTLDATASKGTYVLYRPNGGGGAYAQTEFTLIATSNGEISDAQLASIDGTLGKIAIPNTPVPDGGYPAMSWDGVTPMSGQAVGQYYTRAPGTVSKVIYRPNGDTPDPGDFYSFRYEHHVRISKEPVSGMICVAHSQGAVNEPDTLRSAVQCSADGFQTWTTAATEMYGQFIATGNYDSVNKVAIGSPISYYPRALRQYGGKLYLINALDSANLSDLYANEVHSDGTLGATFRITPQPYFTNAAWHALPTYGDPTISAALYAATLQLDKWGGEQPQQGGLSPWTGNDYNPHGVYSSLSQFQEPETVVLGNGNLLRFWRKTAGAEQSRIYTTLSRDKGQTWSNFFPTTIPNAPTSPAACLLSNGHLALIANPYTTNAYGGRDPLYLVILDPNTGTTLHTYAVKQSYPSPITPTALSANGTTVTVTVSTPNYLTPLEVGDEEIVAGMSPSDLNGNFFVTGVSGSTFTYTMPTAPAESSPTTMGTVNQNIDKQDFAGFSKSGGPTYAGCYEDTAAGTLDIAYSLRGKELIGVSTVPTGGL